MRKEYKQLLQYGTDFTLNLVGIIRFTPKISLNMQHFLKINFPDACCYLSSPHIKQHINMLICVLLKIDIMGQFSAL